MTDYLTLVAESAYISNGYTPLLSLFFLAVSRLFPIVLLAPFFGAKLLPHPVKVTLASSLFVIFLPLLIESTGPVDFNLWLGLLMIKEMFIGIIIGFFVAVPFWIIQSSGMLIDHQRGGASLSVNDPAMQGQSSPLGLLFNQVLIYIFFVIGGPFMFIDSIVLSYELIPPDQLLNEGFFNSESPFWQTQIHIYNKMMKLIVQLASPGLITILMNDVFLGIVNRLAPQIQITFLGMPLKSLLALGVVWYGWKALTNQMVIESHNYLAFLKQVILALAAGVQ